MKVRFPIAMSALLAVLLAATALLAQDKPTQAATQPKPIPDLAGLLTRVRENQVNLEKVRRDYICTVTSTMIDADDKGAEKKRETEQHELFYVAGHEVSRKISKDGKPLTDEEKKKEEEKVQKRIKELEGRQDAHRDEITISVATFLKVSSLQNPRRLQYRDHEVLAVDFAPNPAAKPDTRAEKVAHKISGSIWIDEEALQVARLEARLDENYKIAGGLLASIKPGSSLIFEQQRINNELWLPASAEIVFNARILFSGKHGRISSQFGDYRKFRATAEIKGFAELPTEQQPK
jgi:hypothetical protein